MTDWHIVDVEPDFTTWSGDLDITSNLKNDIEEWIIEQYIDGDFGVWIYKGRCIFGFVEIEDAVACKLRFG